MNELSCLEINPQQTAKQSVIWLHGLGASGHDFEPIVPHLRLPDALAVRFVFPHAPSIPVTVNQGMTMPAWYDIIELSARRRLNEQQFFDSVAATKQLIDREIERGVASDQIILAGFSQGGAVAYHAALEYPKPLAGMMALSTYMACPESLQPHEANRSLPIHLFHGTLDPMVTEAMGQEALEILNRLGYEPEWKSYPMQHEVCLEEVKDISAWMQQCWKLK